MRAPDRHLWHSPEPAGPPGWTAARGSLPSHPCPPSPEPSSWPPPLPTVPLLRREHASTRLSTDCGLRPGLGIPAGRLTGFLELSGPRRALDNLH